MIKTEKTDTKNEYKKTICDLKARIKKEPTNTLLMKELLSARRKECELFIDSLEEAITERVHGLVCVYKSLGNNICIKVCNDDFVFRYVFPKEQIQLRNVERIVYQFMRQYKGEIFRKYIKENENDSTRSD